MNRTISLCLEKAGGAGDCCEQRSVKETVWKQQNRTEAVDHEEENMLPSVESVVPGTEKGQGTEGLEEDLKHRREEACDRETGCGFGFNVSVRFVRFLSLLWVFPLNLQACSGILHLEITTQYSPYLPCWYRLDHIRTWAMAALTS